MLGSGCSEGVPVPGCTCKGCSLGIRRRRTGYVVESKYTRVWLDIGPDFREQLLEYGHLPDAIFISHKHYDHIDGLSDLRQILIVSGGRGRYRPILLVPRHLHMAFMHDPSHVETSIGAYKDLYSTSAADFVMLDEDQAVVLNDLTLRTFSLRHGKIYSAALYLATEDASILYLSDAEKVSAKLISFLDAVGGVDLVIVHAPYLAKMSGHMSIDDALKIPARAYLVSHISHLVDMTPVEIDAYLRERYGENVFSAVDGLVVHVDHNQVSARRTALNTARSYYLR